MNVYRVQFANYITQLVNAETSEEAEKEAIRLTCENRKRDNNSMRKTALAVARVTKLNSRERRMKKRKPKKLGRPATGRDPVRTIRVDDETWHRWQKQAKAAGVSVAAMIRDRMG